MKIKIDKSIPLPPQVGRFKETLDKLKTGESFYHTDIEGARKACFNAHQRGSKRYTTRREPGGVRVWRVS